MRIYGPWLDVHGPITGELVTRWRQNIHLRHGKTEGYANRCLDALRGITGAVASYKLEKPFMRLAVEVRRATRFKEVKKVRRCPPRDVVARVRPLLRSYMEECWYVLISRLMLRRAEMMGLMRQDYVPDERALYVVRQRGKNGVVEHRKGRGRQLKKRLSADSCKRIEWLIEHQQANVTRNGRAKDAPLPGFLFGWSDRYLDRMAKRIREELGADASLYFPKGTNCHAFRHLGVAKKIEAGVTAQGLQDALGHAYPMMAHIYMEEARRDAQVDEVEVDLGDLP
jgi:integrase